VDTRVVYCGDCLDQLRKLPDGCVDLIYIDPPFNSNRNYEVFWGETKEKRAFEDRHASTQAYIEFMRPRCVEIARVLKRTGSFYYHCDSHASHYVKVMLDQIFSENQFQNEIVWRRTTSHNSAQRFGPVHDVILFYTASNDYTWNPQMAPYDESYIKSHYGMTTPEGENFYTGDLTGPGIRSGPSGQPWREFDPTSRGRHWQPASSMYAKYRELTGEDLASVPFEQRLDRLDAAGLIYWPAKRGGFPRYKQLLSDAQGVPLSDVWYDIDAINSQAKERLGYPTQKPLALLERIIKSSSNENDIVLDAFCGCGTALVAAETLKRQWIGIDISPTACRVMAKRLRDDTTLREDETLWKVGRGFVVRDLPWTEQQLRKIPPFEFENWAVIALGGIPNKAQVGDMGIDGRIFPVSSMPQQRPGALPFMDEWFPIQVKQKDKAGRPDIDSFEAAMMRENRKKGFFVSFDFTQDAEREIGEFFKRSGCSIIALTVRDILNEQIARKLT
jgi:DNA modification methylase